MFFDDSHFLVVTRMGLQVLPWAILQTRTLVWEGMLMPLCWRKKCWSFDGECCPRTILPFVRLIRLDELLFLIVTRVCWKVWP